MKIAVPVSTDNNVDDHFGHCDSFSLFTISDEGAITDVKRISSATGCGCKSGMASTLAGEGVVIMLAGGIGAGAINVLNEHGIKVLRGCSGNAEALVKLYLKGGVADKAITCGSHDHHHQGHSCSHN